MSIIDIQDDLLINGRWQVALSIKENHGYAKGFHSFEPKLPKPGTLQRLLHGQLLVQCGTGGLGGRASSLD